MKKELSKKPGKPIIYLNEETGKGLIVMPNRKVKQGSIKTHRNGHRYFQYRLGKKVITDYID